MIRNVQFGFIPCEEMIETYEGLLTFKGRYASARLRITPSLEATLIKKIAKIKAVGFVEDDTDFCAIYWVSPDKVLLEGCPFFCCHTQRIVRDIVEVLKHEGEVVYEGPSIEHPTLM